MNKDRLKKISGFFAALFIGVALACATQVFQKEGATTVRITFYPFLHPESYADVCRAIWTMGTLQLAVIFRFLAMSIKD